MDYRHSEPVPAGTGAAEPRMPTALKILVAGGFGAGKTTMVGTISEIRPLRTEEELTDLSIGVDDVSGVARKTTTTVAMDFGRITFRSDLSLYLFGTPGQQRFWFMWDELAYGSIGAVVIADTRRLGDSFAAIDYFEQRGTPFIIAVNCFDEAPLYTKAEIQEALDLDAGTPVVLCDMRNRESVKNVLVALVRHAIGANRARRERAGAG